MSMVVFRHEDLMEFSRESLEFTCLPKPLPALRAAQQAGRRRQVAQAKRGTP